MDLVCMTYGIRTTTYVENNPQLIKYKSSLYLSIPCKNLLLRISINTMKHLLMISLGTNISEHQTEENIKWR
jgi:hypothetical protein